MAENGLGDAFENMVLSAPGEVAEVYGKVENGVEVEKQTAVSASYGLIPVCVMAVSALVMLVCGLLMRKPKMKWLGEYALPISLVLGMAAAIPLTAWLG